MSSCLRFFSSRRLPPVAIWVSRGKNEQSSRSIVRAHGERELQQIRKNKDKQISQSKFALVTQLPISSHLLHKMKKRRVAKCYQALEWMNINYLFVRAVLKSSSNPSLVIARQPEISREVREMLWMAARDASVILQHCKPKCFRTLQPALIATTWESFTKMRLVRVGHKGRGRRRNNGA